MRRPKLDSRVKSRLGRLTAFLGVCLFSLTLVQCSEDPTEPVLGGGLALELQFADGWSATGAADSLRIWVQDENGLPLGPSQTVAYAEDGFDLEFRLPNGENRAVEARLESDGFRGRNASAWGRVTGVAVTSGRETHIRLSLAGVVPALWPIEPAPGDLGYVVTWTTLAMADEYELLETKDSVETSYSLADTMFAVSLKDPEEAATEVTYRVRSRGVHGSSIFSDPVTILPSEIRDLPHVASVSPSAGAIGVLDTSTPVLTFDRPMDWATLSTSTVNVTDLDLQTEFSVFADGAGASLTLTHFDAFPRGHHFLIELEPGLLGADGRPFDQDPVALGLQGFQSDFFVEVYDPLRVVSTLPENGSTDVSITSAVELDFNRAFDGTTATDETVFLLNSTRDVLPIALTVTSTRILITPDDPLSYSEAYTVEVSTELLDLRGESLDQDSSTPIPTYEAFSSSFATEVQPVGALVVGSDPSNGEDNFASFAEVQIEFDREMNPVTVVAQSTMHLRRLPTQASIPGQVVAESGNRRFTFVPSNPLEPGTGYRLEATTGILDESGVPLDQDPVEPGFQGFQAEFRVEESLTVVRIAPANRETGIPPTTGIEIEFNLPADPASLALSSVILELGGQPVDVDRTLSNDGYTANLLGREPFEVFSEYTVRINETLLSEEGGRFDQNLSADGYQEFTSRFTTRPDSIPPKVASVTPTDLATEVAPRPAIEVTFTRRIQPGSFNSSTVSLRPQGGGDPVAVVLSVSADSLLGSLELVSDLDLDREYELLVTNWIVDRFDVRLDQDPIAPDRQSFVSHFHTDVERVPPRVIAVRPIDGEEQVSLLGTLGVDFSEPMDAASLALGFTLLLDGQSVPGGVEAFNDDESARFTPALPLMEDRVYQVRLSGAATDLVGNPLDMDPDTSELDPFLSFFTTELDLVGPFVMSIFPESDASGVEPDISPSLVFSEAIDSTTVLAGVTVYDSTGVTVGLSGFEMVSFSQIELSFTQELETNHRYRLDVQSTLRDTVGNAFDQDGSTEELDPFTSYFTTREESTPPQVHGVFFDATPPPQTTSLRVVFSEPIDPTSLDEGDVYLQTRDDQIEVAIDMSFVSPDTLVVQPVEQLLALTDYELVVQDLTDLVGNILDQNLNTPEADPLIKYFETAPDSRSPIVEESTPAEGETGVPADVVVSIYFDEPMDPSTFGELFYRVIRLEGSQEYPAGGVISWDEDLRRFHFTPDTTLLEGFYYLIRADFHLRDLAGNPLDQDPSTPIEDEFLATFLVGEFPVADAGAAVCGAEVPEVVVDGSASFDPDGTIVRAVWQWGDGEETEILSPASADLIAEHTYSCVDLAGCDGLDNDGDGLIDGDDCDESYRIILRIEDEDGLKSADTTGVSFCGFGILGTDPADGATEVDTLLTEITIDFTRSLADSSLNGEAFDFRKVGSFIPFPLDSIRFGVDSSQVVLELADTLEVGAEYELIVEEPLDSSGRPYDADPCTPDPDPYAVRFTALPAPEPRQR